MNTTTCTRALVLMSACALFILPSCRWRKKDSDMSHKKSTRSTRRHMQKEQPAKAVKKSVHNESRRAKRHSKAVASKSTGNKKSGFWSWFGGNKKEGTEKTMSRAERRAHKKARNSSAPKQDVISAKEKMSDGHGNMSNSRYNK